MAHRVRRFIALIAMFSIIGMLVVACGGGQDTTGAEQGAATPAPTTPADPVITPEPGTEAEATPDTGMTEEVTPDTGMTEEVTPDTGMTEEVTPDTGMTEEATPDTGTGTTGAAGGTMELPADCTNVQLTYWNPFTGPDGPYMGEMVQAFNDAHPDIQVEMTSQGEYYTQLGTAAASNTLPDIAIVHADQIATQVFRNVLRPMDDLMQNLTVSEGDFPEAVWGAGEVAGRRYAIPLDIHPMTMFYNQDLLSGAGINAPPTNRQEFEAAAEAMTGDGNYGFMITQGFPVQQIFSMLLHQNGGSWFNEEGTEATWNSPEGVEALQWMLDMQSRFSEPNLEVDAEINSFKGGNVGMIWNGIWQTTNVTGEGVEFNGQATAVPQIFDQPAVWAGSHQFTLPTQQQVDQCKDAATAIFIDYMLDNSATWAQAGQIPANNQAREGLAGQNIEPQASIAPSVENAIFPPSVPGITDAFAPLDEAVGLIMSGGATDIQAALDDAANRANQILEENRNNYGDTPPGQ